MTNAVSRVSSTTVRKRTMASAPTRLNARAMLSLMTTVTSEISTLSSRSVGRIVPAGPFPRTVPR